MKIIEKYTIQLHVFNFLGSDVYECEHKYHTLQKENEREREREKENEE